MLSILCRAYKTVLLHTPPPRQEFIAKFWVKNLLQEIFLFNWLDLALKFLPYKIQKRECYFIFPGLLVKIISRVDLKSEWKENKFSTKRMKIFIDFHAYQVWHFYLFSSFSLSFSRAMCHRRTHTRHIQLCLPIISHPKSSQRHDTHGLMSERANFFIRNDFSFLSFARSLSLSFTKNIIHTCPPVSLFTF